MLETITIITLTLLLLTILRPGKTPPLENPLTINRIGQFHAVLAPRINLAQPLLETVSTRLTEQDRKAGNTAPLYFKVQDQEVKAHGDESYLLAATLRDGMLYFQATAPKSGENDLDTIRAFSEAELTRHPDTQPHVSAAAETLTSAIQTAAGQRGAVVTPLALH